MAWYVNYPFLLQLLVPFFSSVILVFNCNIKKRVSFFGLAYFVFFMSLVLPVLAHISLDLENFVLAFYWKYFLFLCNENYFVARFILYILGLLMVSQNSFLSCWVQLRSWKLISHTVKISAVSLMRILEKMRWLWSLLVTDCTYPFRAIFQIAGADDNQLTKD